MHGTHWSLFAVWLLNTVCSTSALTLQVTYSHSTMYLFFLQVQLDEDGEVYCAARLNPSDNPSVSMMIYNTGLDGWRRTSVQANTVTAVIIMSLTPGQVYDLYCYAENAYLSGHPSHSNTGDAGIASSKLTAVSTASGGDYIVPEFSYTAPYEEAGSAAVRLFTQLNEEGTVYCGAVANGSVQPTRYQLEGNIDLLAWASGSAYPHDNYKATIRLEPLSPDTTYDFYCFAEDTSGNGIDGLPAYVENSTKITETKRTIKTLFIYLPTQFTVTAAEASTSYVVQPASWNNDLPNRFISGNQERRDLECWSTPLALVGASIVSHEADIARGCKKLPSVPRGGGPFVAILRRGGCSFHQKATRAYGAGFHGLIVIDHRNTLNNTLPDMTSESDDADREIQIPSWIIGKTDGESVASAAAVFGAAKLDVTDVFRKPKLNRFIVDEFGGRFYATQ